MITKIQKIVMGFSDKTEEMKHYEEKKYSSPVAGSSSRT